MPLDLTLNLFDSVLLGLVRMDRPNNLRRDELAYQYIRNIPEGYALLLLSFRPSLSPTLFLG